MKCSHRRLAALLLAASLSPALHAQTIRAVPGGPVWRLSGAPTWSRPGGAIGLLPPAVHRPFLPAPGLKAAEAFAPPSLSLPLVAAPSAARALPAGETVSKTVFSAPAQLRSEVPAALDARMNGMAAALTDEKRGDAVRGTPSLQPIDLERSIQASGMAPHVSELKKHSKGVMTAYDFLKMTGQLRSGYILGLAGAQDTFNVFAEVSGLKPWSVSYREFGIPWSEPDHTRIFMENITRSRQPIVFLVPNDYDTHPRAKLTRDEMAWLLAAPAERMANVIFVFGAYDLISSADYAAHYASKEPAQRRKEQVEALRALQRTGR